MKIILDTQRLILREFTSDDAGLIYELNKDPEVTRWTGDPIRDEAHGLEVLEKTIIPQYALYNHGRWAVLVKPGMDPISIGFIGWCGLKARPERKEIDLGYRFTRESWGKGYATEAASASLCYGFETLKLGRIVGRAMPQNIGSLRVLEKCGMSFVCEEIMDNHPARTYEAINPFISS